MNEKQAFDRMINALTDHNLVLSKDYIIQSYNKGCFNIKFCPRQRITIDIQYLYEMIPDIVICKITHTKDTMFLNIKIRLR